jgi:uncharacterized phage infection (PIP) family protein YhgE
MIETSPTSPESSVVYVQPTRSNTSFGLRAGCFVLAAAVVVLISMVYQSRARLADTTTKLVQAQSEADQAKSDIQGANTKAADLQRQLTAATAQSTDLQAQLKTAQGQSTGLQSQIDKATGQDTDLRAQLAAAKSKLADSEATANKANESSNQLRKDLDASKAQAADLQSQLTKAQGDHVAVLAPVLAVLPVTTAFEKGFWGNTYTLHIKNTNSEPLNVTITVNGSGSAQPISTAIRSGETYDLPKLAAGSNVVVASDGFTPLSLSAH